MNIQSQREFEATASRIQQVGDSVILRGRSVIIGAAAGALALGETLGGVLPTLAGAAGGAVTMIVCESRLAREPEQSKNTTPR